VNEGSSHNRFTTQRKVSPAEIDELGHVSNLVYLQWILEVARAHSDAGGYDQDAYRALGAVFVVRRHEVDYLRSAVAGNEILLSTWVETWKAASCVRRTDVTSPDRSIVYARASTRWAYVSFETQRPQRIPESLLSAFS